MDAAFPDLLKPFLKYAGTQPITSEASLHELGLDSMRAIELLFAIEDTYGVSMPDELLTDRTFATAGSLWDTIESLRGRTA
ncbi:acyl carrier protein [Salinispora arenicola]|uniref:phosphopantetheine-binding protein n=1 Tax=Salinispora TaxID=168694 RepID=UPI000367BE66|nr:MULTISPECIES: phosphopantetheine-binding protein [Salinispora]NIL42978.1 acyl carrier protein [Salinispora arenicola]